MASKEILLKAPSGTRDFLPSDALHRQSVFAILRQNFELFGFMPIETPAFERLECLTGKYGSEQEKLIFKILKRGDKAASGESDLALRYDLTVPLVRFYCEHRHEIRRPFKRYQIAPVWRADRPARGRFREFYQCDIDTLGAPFGLADAEVILALTTAMKALGLRNFTIRLNSREVLQGILAAYDVPEPRYGEVISILDKLDKIGPDGMTEELRQRGLPDGVVNALSTDLGDEDPLSSARLRLAGSDVGSRGLAQVEELFSLLAPFTEGFRVLIDPFLARGLDYYTGPVFEAYAEGMNSALAGGGRYDGLVRKFSGQDVPACGGSLGLERILLLAQSEISRPGAEVAVTVWNNDFRHHSLRLAQMLRGAGIRTEVVFDGGKIGKQIGAVAAQSVLFAVIFGPAELERGDVIVKDLTSGSQEAVKEGQLAEYLRTRLAVAGGSQA